MLNSSDFAKNYASTIGKSLRGAHDHLVRRARPFCSQGTGYGKQLNLSATVTLGPEKVARVAKRWPL